MNLSLIFFISLYNPAILTYRSYVYSFSLVTFSSMHHYIVVVAYEMLRSKSFYSSLA